jgi:AbrB family looped-hinge helix DNA binding protein
MPSAEKLTTIVSTKGQVILPKVIRDRRHWASGTKLVVEDTDDGVLLRPVPLFKATSIAQVAGMLAYQGKAKSIEEMDDAVAREAKRRARD